MRIITASARVLHSKTTNFLSSVKFAASRAAGPVSATTNDISFKHVAATTLIDSTVTLETSLRAGQFAAMAFKPSFWSQ